MTEITPITSPVLLQPHPFSKGAKVIARVDPGGTIEDIIGLADIPAIYHGMIRVEVGAKEVPRELWGRVRPKQGHVVYVRVIPHGGGGGGGKNPVRTLLAIAIIVAAVYVGNVFGPGIAASLGVTSAAGVAAVSAAVTAVVATAGTLLLNSLIPPPNPLGPQDRSIGGPSYQITGTQNRLAPYEAVPRVFGRRRMYPVYGARPYTESQGDNQYLRILLIVGYGPLRITDIKIGETPISGYEGVELEVTEGGPTGWAGNQNITLYTRQIREENLSVELTTAVGYETRTTQTDAREISIDIVAPGGMVKYDDEGNRQNVDARFDIEYRLVGSSTWLLPSWETSSDEGFSEAGRLTIDENTTRAVRRSGRFKVATAGQYQVRIRRENGNIDKGTDRTFWTALRTIRYESPVRYPGLAMIAMRIKASEQLNGVPDAINCIAESYLPVYSGSSWSYQVTSNPAWAFADILRRRGQEVVLPDSRLDLVAIKAWADACDAPAPNGAGARWTFNAVMEGGSIFNAMRTVASHGRATPTMKDGKFSIVRDIQQSVPVQHITPRNSANYTGSKLFLDIPEALRVRFVNAARGFVEDEVIVYDDGQNEFNTEKFETIELFGCTDKNQAWREGRYHLAVMKLRPEEHIVEMDIEALRCTIGDLVFLNHDVILIGRAAGRILSRTLNGSGQVIAFTLDGSVTLPYGVICGLRVRRSDGSTIVHQLATVPEDTETDVVQLAVAATASTAGNVGDLFMFGTLGNEAAPMIVKRIEAQRDLSARLVLVDAQSGVYTADTGLIPDFDDNITIEVPVTQKAPPSVTFALRSDETALLVLADGTLQDRLVVTINPVAASDVRATSFDVQFKESSSASWVLVGRILENDRELPITGVVQGRSYDVRVRSVSATGVASIWTTITDHVVVGKTTRPSDVEMLIATVDPQLGLTLSWPRVNDLDVSYYDLRRGTSWPTGIKIAEVKGTSFSVGVLPIGTYNYRIRAVDTIGLTSALDAGIQVSITQPAAPVVTFALADDQVVLSWAQPNPQQRITDFEVAFGPSYGSATVLGRTKSTVFRATADFVGERTFWVTAVDVAGNRSAGSSVPVNISALDAPIGLVASITGPDILLSWFAPAGSLSVAEYEIRYGESYAAGDRITRVTANSFRFKADFVGSRTYWIAGIDKAGNVGAAASATLSITAPGSVTLSQQIVDNNVLLRWTAPTTQLPIANYQIRKGAVYASAEIVGSIDGLFSTVFESTAGTFLYWVVPVDTAGNFGTPASIAATVSAPPDFDLLYDQFSTFSGTNVGFVADGTASAAPINNTETYEEHFTSRGWASPQAQVDAGFPYWIQPTLTSGYYEEVIDYGATLPGTRIVVTLTYQTVIGVVTVTPTISVKLNAGDAWTDYPGVTEIYASNFRYFKVRIDITTVSGGGFIDISGLNLRLDVKLKTDSGSGTANASDTTGTTVLFNKPFIDVNSITVTPKGTTARLAIYDFTDVPNPTSFKVLLFDTSGNRVSGDFSWNAKGV